MDVFISYAHNDDPKWIAKFHKSLHQELKTRLGREVKIWRDPQMPVGTEWKPEMLAAARSAPAFVAVVSPGWLASQYCQREFAEASGNTLFSVRLLPVEMPERLRSRLYQDLFEMGEDQVPRTFKAESRSFEKGVERVAHGVADLLRQPASTIDAQVAAIRVRIAPQIRERCGRMRILDMEQPINSAAIYTRVNLLEKIASRQSRTLDELNAALESQDSFRLGIDTVRQERLDAQETVDKHRRLMMLGKPGAGKTTFLRRLAYLCVVGEFRPDLVPAYIELRELGSKTLQEHINGLWGVDPLPLFNAGRALLLLDGLDEVPAICFQELWKQIDLLSQSESASPMLVTCRLAGREYSFEQFTEVEVADFDENQIREFANSWFSAKELPGHGDALLEKLKQNPPMLELAQSPLLLTLICLLFERRPDFDGSRAELYGEAFDTLLSKWDARRAVVRETPYRRLTLGLKKDLLAEIAFDRFQRNEYLFETSGLEGQIRNFFDDMPGGDEEINPAVIIRAIESQHGLLVERASGIHSFSHLTFQEYFTARRIVAGSGDEDRWHSLLEHLYEPRWREVLLLVASMVSPADSLLVRMRQSIDMYLRDYPPIQNFLRWLSRKANTVDELYKPAAIRAFYWQVGQVEDARRLRIRSSFGDLFIGDLDQKLHRDLELGSAHLLNLDLDLSRALDQEHAVAQSKPRAIARYFGLALGRRVSLTDEFADQLNQLRKSAQVQELDGSWFDALQAALMAHRDLGHRFALEGKHFDLLHCAYYGYGVLINCLNIARITKAARQHIEDTLFLPWDEIQQRSQLPPTTIQTGVP